MTIQYLGRNLTDGASVAQAGGKAALYGSTPVSQRASSVQATSYLSASSNVTVAANLTAIVLEIANTFIGLGAWKGSA